jgi:hypothetical protein
MTSMIEARIDSMLPVHPQVRILSDSAFRLYISAICWASLQGTGGHIPAKHLRYISDVRRSSTCAEQIVEAGLWKAVKDGWQILDYLHQHPDAKQVSGNAKQALSRSSSATRRDPTQPKERSA